MEATKASGVAQCWGITSDVVRGLRATVAGILSGILLGSSVRSAKDRHLGRREVSRPRTTRPSWPRAWIVAYRRRSRSVALEAADRAPGITLRGAHNPRASRGSSACAEHLSKGRSVGVVGRLNYREWQSKGREKRSKYEVIGRVIFGGKSDDVSAADARGTP